MEALDAIIGVWRGGGFLLLPLALVSALIFAWFFRSCFSVGPIIREAKHLGAALESCGGDAVRIQARLQEKDSWITETYAGCLDASQTSKPLQACLEEVEDGCLKMQSRDLILLAAFTGAAPLLGLLGTVVGMIATFQATANVSGDTGQQIADGISSALITTQFGLVIALPGVVGMAHLQKRIRDLETYLSQCRFLILGGLVSERTSHR
ncbi:MotA/TolQ/ExbB proton channel family protein [Kiritimatiellaeota bacterium B1221]|nr:MotA/TolQ/ExbB proton channel family protein [Kiritimatiellaeota bacterium B1221]